MNFYLYNPSEDFDKVFELWINFIKSKKEEIDTIDNSLYSRMIIANNANELIKDTQLGIEINNSLPKDSKGKNFFYNFYKREKFDKLLQGLSFKICPYCGCQNLNGGSGFATTTEIDHYLDRSSYPQYSGNPYNLVPVCRNCNNPKSNQDVEIFDNIKGGTINNFYPQTKFNIDGLYFSNEIDNTHIISSNEDLIDKCKIIDRYSINRNQSNLQRLLENCENGALAFNCDILHILNHKISEKHRDLLIEPYANFDKHFYELLRDMELKKTH